MSKPRYKWWGYVKNVIRAFPELKREYAALHIPTVTASISGMPLVGGVSRGTELIATKQLPAQKQKELDAVAKAIETTAKMTTGKDRLSVVDLVFWRQSHTLAGAALQIHVSYDTAIGYHGEFIILTAYYLGLVSQEEIEGSQKIALKSQKSVVC